MTFLLKLREAAKGCSNVDYRNRLRWAADSIGFAIEDLHGNPTEDQMRFLNGVWAYAEKTFKNMPPEGTANPPLAPAVELPENIEAPANRKAA